VRRIADAEDGAGSTPYAVACDRVLRYLRLVGFCRGGDRVRIVNTDDRGTHWLLTFGVSSLEDPSRDFMQAGIVAEKGTGFLYAFPSRSRQPIDAHDIESVRRGCTRITPDDLDAMEEEQKSRGPICWSCGSANVHCDGGRVFLVAGIDGEFVRWMHTCRDCGRQVDQWVSEPRAASVWHCPHFDCEAVRRAEDH
jgi:hypothetical protein